MKKYITNLVFAFSFLISLNVNSAENQQEKIINLLLSMQNINVNELSDFCSEEIQIKENLLQEGLSYKMLTGNTNEFQEVFENDLMPQFNAKVNLNKFETRSVVINKMEGYTFHIADYFGQWGNSRIVTCLDGELRGLQGIADNGVIMAQSTDVTWHKNYFVHRYPKGKVTSYPNKQTCEFRQ